LDRVKSKEKIKVMTQGAVAMTLSERHSFKKATFQTDSRILVHPERKRS